MAFFGNQKIKSNWTKSNEPKGFHMVKYQDKIHKAFAKHISDEADKRYKDAIAHLPKAAANKLDVSDFMDEDAAAIEKGNYSICDFFTADESRYENLTDNRKRTVPQVVRAYAVGYRAALDNASNEQDEEYAKIHGKLVKVFEEYFSLTAELLLDGYYGNEYSDFSAKFTAEEEKRQKERIATRKANQSIKEKEENA